LPRIPPVSTDSLTPEQQQVYDKIVGGPRGVVIGPLRALLHSPELADRWQSLGEYLRYQSCFSLALRELAIIAAARYWNSQLEWLVHANVAQDAGVCKQAIEAIRTTQAPAFSEPDQAAVYEFARELLGHGRVSDEVYDDVRARFDTVGVVELTALIGYYSMVAMTLNAHHVPLPEMASRIEPLLIDDSDGTLPAPSKLPGARLVTHGVTEGSAKATL
jgi:4-carboxymuconolactone decarboxylase